MSKNFFRHLGACLSYAFAICVSNTINAQPLSLYDAVNKTIISYPLLQQRQAEVSAGRAHLNTVNGNRLPSLILQDQLNMGTDNSLQGAYFSLGIVPSTPGSYTAVRSSPNTGNTAISFLKWEFYTFGYYNAQKKEAKAQLSVNEANLSADKYLLTQQIISLYLDWLKKYRLLQIERENLQRAQLIFTAIRATVASGLKPGVDSSTAGAAYSDARLSYLRALDNYNNDGISIAAFTGINPDGIVPDTNIFSPTLLQDAIQGPAAENVTPSHPLLDVFQKQYDQQVASNSSISHKYLPRLGLDAATWLRNSGISPTGVYPDNLGGGMPYSRYNYLFGVTLTYNLFDLRHRRDELTEGKYLAEGKKSALQTQQLMLTKMMQQANATYVITLEKLKEVPVQLFSARQAYNQQMALYRSGLNTLLEVTNAQYALLQAETNYVITQDDLLQILYIRAGLSGQLDNFLQKFKK
jgi:outer membrane protein, adhesin transport system